MQGGRAKKVCSFNRFLNYVKSTPFPFQLKWNKLFAWISFVCLFLLLKKLPSKVLASEYIANPPCASADTKLLLQQKFVCKKETYVSVKRVFFCTKKGGGRTTRNKNYCTKIVSKANTGKNKLAAQSDSKAFISFCHKQSREWVRQRI
jgi:hypothetical protein